MQKSNRITIIVTALITSVVSIGLFIGFLLAYDWFYSEPVQSATDEPQTEESLEEETEASTELLIVDNHDILDEDSETYVRTTVSPIANKHFDIVSISFHGVDADNRTHVSLTVTSESLGRMVSQKLAAGVDADERQEFAEDIEKHVKRVSQLLAMQFDKVAIEYTTPDMGNKVFMRLFNQEIAQDYFDMTGTLSQED